MENAPRGSETAFGRTLEQYKQRGCSVLVSGEVPADVVDLASRKLMGAPDAQRLRLFALLDRSPDTVVRRLPCPDPEDAYLVETPEIARHATTDAATTTNPDGPLVPAASAATGPEARTPTAGTNDVDAFRDDTIDAIRTLGARTTEPSELRVAVDSLRPLLADGLPATTDFVDAISTELEHATAMGHFVLPIANDAPELTALEDAVDVTIRLDVENGHPVQSWRLPDADLETDWLYLDG